MSTGLQFSEEEIKEKLKELGYNDIPPKKLKEFSRDLQQLIEYEQSQRTSSQGFSSYSSPESIHTESYLSTDQNTVTDELNSTQSSRGDQGYFNAISRERVQFEPSNRPATSHMTRNYSSGKENREQLTVASMGHHRTAVFLSSPSDNYREVQPVGKTTCKRKVLRRKEGESRVFDESYTDSESGSSIRDISELEQRLRNLPIQGKDVYESDLENKEPQDYRPWINGANPSLPSFIRPSTSHPHTCGFRKCDPVNRFHQFQYEWRMNKAPGEKSRKSLRWGVRGHMLQCEMFERPQRNYKPNSYVVPTEKKRQALRWQVRTNMV